MNEFTNIPTAWLERLPSPAPLAWFAEFRRHPEVALDALLWENMYLDHDHPREREDLLSNWVALIGDAEDFTARLDQGLADWINANWSKPRAGTSAAFHARVWSAALHTVHLCSPQMPNAAQALLERFPQRVDWLGRWSTGPGHDPLGAMLLAVTGYQTTRQLAPLWQRMAHLPDGIPVHHAGIALEGVLQLPPEINQKPGVYRTEFARVLVDFALALDYRVQRRDINEKAARTLWQRLQRMALARLPFGQKWKDDIALMLSRKDDKEADGWVIGGMARDWLYSAFDLNDEAVGQHFFKLRNRGTIHWNGEWPIKASELGGRRDIGQPGWRVDAETLLGEQVRYAQYTGDTHACVRSLCRLSSKVRKIDSALAEQWARQAIELEPHNPFAYTTQAEALRASGTHRLDDALSVYVECIERFPDEVVARAGLAEVLKELGRLDDAEAQYLDTIERFPDEVVARAGLAEVLKELGRLDDAEAQYLDTIERFPDDVVARAGLAEVLKELGRLDGAEAQYLDTIERFPDEVVARNGLAEVLKEMGRLPEAQSYYEQVLKIDSTNSYARGGLKRLNQPAAVAVKGTTHPDGRRVPTRDAFGGLALRQRRMARYRSASVPSEVAESALPQWEQEDMRTDLAHAELVFEVLAANRLEPAREMLTAALHDFPNSAALLTAQARLERLEAQAAGIALSDEAKQKVLTAPTNLRARFPDLAPVYWLEHGLAFHALTDGQVRLNAVADSFEQIRRIAEQPANPHDPDAVFRSSWATGVMQMAGAFNDPKQLSDRITALGHKLDVREEEPVFRREAAGRWQPLQLAAYPLLVAVTMANAEEALPDYSSGLESEA